MSEKVGVYICHCGSNIAGVVDVEEVAKWAGENLENVTVSREYKFMCSSLGQELIEEDIKKEGLTRDIKRTSYYEKPSERRRRRQRKSLKRIAREQAGP